MPANRHDHIKRVLDNGAMGVVVPMVNSRQEALAAVAAWVDAPAGGVEGALVGVAAVVAPSSPSTSGAVRAGRLCAESGVDIGFDLDATAAGVTPSDRHVRRPWALSG